MHCFVPHICCSGDTLKHGLESMGSSQQICEIPCRLSLSGVPCASAATQSQSGLCRSSNDDNFYLDDEERRIGNPWTHAKLITEASIALDLDADTSTLPDDEYYVVDVSTNLPVSPNISPVGLPSCKVYFQICTSQEQVEGRQAIWHVCTTCSRTWCVMNALLAIHAALHPCTRTASYSLSLPETSSAEMLEEDSKCEPGHLASAKTPSAEHPG